MTSPWPWGVQKFLEQCTEILTVLEESNTMDYIKKIFFHLSHHLNSEQAAHGQEEICKTDIPCLIVTCFTVLCRYCLIFFKEKFYGSPDTSKMVGTIFFFLTAFAHLVSLGHFWLIFAVFQTFVIICVVMISDQWCLELLLQKILQLVKASSYG